MIHDTISRRNDVTVIVLIMGHLYKAKSTGMRCGVISIDRPQDLNEAMPDGRAGAQGHPVTKDIVNVRHLGHLSLPAIDVGRSETPTEIREALSNSVRGETRYLGVYSP